MDACGPGSRRLNIGSYLGLSDSLGPHALIPEKTTSSTWIVLDIIKLDASGVSVAACGVPVEVLWSKLDDAPLGKIWIPSRNLSFGWFRLVPVEPCQRWQISGTYR